MNTTNTNLIMASYVLAKKHTLMMKQYNEHTLDLIFDNEHDFDKYLNNIKTFDLNKKGTYGFLHMRKFIQSLTTLELMNCHNINIASSFKNATPLYVACMNRDIESIKKLLFHPNINANCVVAGEPLINHIMSDVKLLMTLLKHKTFYVSKVTLTTIIRTQPYTINRNKILRENFY